MEEEREPGHGSCPAEASGTERSLPPAGDHVACHFFKVYSDPPGAHIYADGTYWGKTDLDKPVTGHCWCKVEWNAEAREWRWAKNTVFATSSVLRVTFTAKRVNSSDATQVVELQGQDFEVRHGTPEELAAAGLVGKCPVQGSNNTTDVMLVLQSSDIISG